MVQKCTAGEPAWKALTVGYSFVVFLMLLYMWENGWWHISRKHESMYMIFVLVGVPFTNIMSSVRQYSLCFYQTSSWELADMLFRQVVMLLLIFQMQRRIWPQMHGVFFDGRLCEPSARKASRYAGGIVRDIDTTLEAIMEQSPALIPNSLLPPVLFSICIAEQLLWSLKGDEVHSIVCGYISVGILFVGLANMVWKIYSTTPRIDHLDEVFRRLVTSGDKDTLQYVLANISVPTLFEVSNDRMLRLLTDVALDQKLLSPLTKAILVNALQVRGLRFNKLSQQAVLRIMQSVRGTDFTALKNLLDGSGGYQNLYKLLYVDLISGSPLQRRLLKHIEDQGRVARASGGGRLGIKVLSDVDDTLYCSGGSFPAGCDRRFPKHMVYPGCLSLFRILDASADHQKPLQDSLDLRGVVSCNLIFLSARPHIYKDVAEGQSYRLFKHLVREERLHCSPTLIPGTLLQGLRAMVTYPFLRTSAWRQVGVNKHLTYLKFRCLYPEYDFVFCGDNGQGDLYAAQLMLKSQRNPRKDLTTALRENGEDSDGSSASPSSDSDSASDLELLQSSSSGGRNAASKPRSKVGPQMLACFIHEVIPMESALAAEPVSQRDAMWRERQLQDRIFFHRSYIGAAVSLHEFRPDIISASGVAEVAREAMREYEADRCAHEDCRQSDWYTGEGHLVDDLARANQVLDHAGILPLEKMKSVTRDPSRAELEEASSPPEKRSGCFVPLCFGVDDRDEESADSEDSLLGSEVDTATNQARAGQKVTFSPVATQYIVAPRAGARPLSPRMAAQKVLHAK